MTSVPLPVTIRGAKVPLPTLAGAGVAILGLIFVMVFHTGARYVGIAWLLAGLAL